MSSILAMIRITVRIQESEIRIHWIIELPTDFDEILWRAGVWPRDQLITFWWWSASLSRSGSPFQITIWIREELVFGGGEFGWVLLVFSVKSSINNCIVLLPLVLLPNILPSMRYGMIDCCVMFLPKHHSAVNHAVTHVWSICVYDTTSCLI